MSVFTEEQVAALERWQACGWVHELTCIESSHGALIVSAEGLRCAHCKYHQTQVPEMCVGPLPPNPADIFRN